MIKEANKSRRRALSLSTPLPAELLAVYHEAVARQDR
jgi:hypothetical protein